VGIIPSQASGQQVMTILQAMFKLTTSRSYLKIGGNLHGDMPIVLILREN
jgi:hypothetical protein